MNLTTHLKHGREAFLDRAADAATWENRLFSGTTYALWRASREVMQQHCSGLALDAGSGRESWKQTVLRSASGYESIDIAPRGESHPTWIGDVTNMPAVPDARYDTVVCHQVLEHVRRPWAAIAEFHRVLKPGGKLIISAPHLSRRHELPHDYFRFTQEGMAALLEDASFTGISVRTYGGIAAFLHHQLSFFFPGLFVGLPLVGPVTLALNAPLSWLSATVDDLLDRPRLMPVGVIAVATKPGGS